MSNKNTIPAAVVEANRKDAIVRDDNLNNEVLQTLMDSVARIVEFAQTTREDLGVLSRDALQHVVLDNTGNVQILNKLFMGLKGAQLKGQIKFYRAFVPHEFDDETGTFGKKLDPNSTRAKKKRSELVLFLENADNNCWSYLEREKAPTPKTPPAEKFRKALMAAKKDMSDMQICSIIGNAGISILELNAMITELQGLADIALAANAAGDTANAEQATTH